MLRIKSRRMLAVLLSAGTLAAAISSPAVHAADAKGVFALHGIGALTCSQMGESIKANAAVRDQLAVWLLGYMSATNRARPDNYDITPIQQPLVLATMVSNLCTSNASARVETVVHSVLTALAPAGSRAESPLVRAEAGKNVVELRGDTLMAVQQALIDRKILRDKATGAFGTPTEKALGEFQKAQKLNVTGLPDPVTVMRLLIEKPAP